MTRFALLLPLAAALGCGGPTHYPVSGKVQFADGTPLAHGRVAVNYGHGLGGVGWLKPDGTFVIGSNATDDGVPPGVHKVAIDNAVTPTPAGYDPKFVAKPLIHPKFNDPETSGLTFEVPKEREWVITVHAP